MLWSPMGPPRNTDQSRVSSIEATPTSLNVCVINGRRLCLVGRFPIRVLDRKMTSRARGRAIVTSMLNGDDSLDALTSTITLFLLPSTPFFRRPLHVPLLNRVRASIQATHHNVVDAQHLQPVGPSDPGLLLALGLSPQLRARHRSSRQAR